MIKNYHCSSDIRIVELGKLFLMRHFQPKTPGLSCSKLTMLLVNISFKLLITKYGI